MIDNKVVLSTDPKRKIIVGFKNYDDIKNFFTLAFSEISAFMKKNVGLIDQEGLILATSSDVGGNGRRPGYKVTFFHPEVDLSNIFKDLIEQWSDSQPVGTDLSSIKMLEQPPVLPSTDIALN